MVSAEFSMPATKLPVAAEADVVVIGAGAAGFGAAVAAARRGADTLLIEYFGGPGGMISSGYNTTIRSPGTGICTEFFEAIQDLGQVSNSRGVYPGLTEPVLETSRSINTHPGVVECVMLEMLRKEKVGLLFRTPFVDAAVRKGSGDGTIEAILVTNASGLQVIKGKTFIDATGRANVCIKAGVPYMSAGEGWSVAESKEGVPYSLEGERPLPCPLCFMYSGVDMHRVQEYNLKDPGLAEAIEAAVAAGDLPPIDPNNVFQPALPYITYARKYKFHPSPQIAPMTIPGNFLAEVKTPYVWGLRPGESGADASLAEVIGRQFILQEWKFLRKYVPGFENSVIASIAPMLCYRDGARPLGEYTVTYDDVIHKRSFPDAVLRKQGLDSLYNGGQFGPPDLPKRKVSYDIPYRAFLPKGVNNLLVAGDCMCYSAEVRVNLFKQIMWSMITGEVAGVSAAKAAKEGISVKEVKWTSYYTTQPV